MPRKKKSNVASEMPTATEPKIPKELLDQLITGPITQSEFESIYRALKKAIIERCWTGRSFPSRPWVRFKVRRCRRCPATSICTTCSICGSLKKSNRVYVAKPFWCAMRMMVASVLNGRTTHSV